MLLLVAYFVPTPLVLLFNEEEILEARVRHLKSREFVVNSQ
jgi:hypothetical protein